jgi:hypothetical protein
MFGFVVFKSIYDNLENFCQNKVLGNIFNIGNVAVSSFNISNNKVIFKFFSNGVFYQYVLKLDIGEDRVEYNNNIFKYEIFTFNESFSLFNEFVYGLYCCQTEKDVYDLIRDTNLL